MTFLTDDEKRAAAGYEPLLMAPSDSPAGSRPEGAETEVADTGAGPFDATTKYRPDQPRVAAGNPDGGQWTDEGGGASSYDIAQSRGGRNSTSVRVGGRSFEGTPSQVMRLSNATNTANREIARVREVDPEWRPSVSAFETIEGAIAAREAELREAQSRIKELYKDAIPNTNPSWGVNRLRKELNNRGYKFEKPPRSEGFIYSNPLGEEVRIMRKPQRRYRTDPVQKFLNEYYYRYRPSEDKAWGRHITIPDKFLGL